MNFTDWLRAKSLTDHGWALAGAAPCARSHPPGRPAAARCIPTPAVPRYNRAVQAGSSPNRGTTDESPQRAAACGSWDRTGARRINRSRRVRHRPAAGPGPASGGRHRRVRRDVQLRVRSERRQALRPGVSRDVASGRPAEDRPRSGHPHGAGGDGAGPGHGDGAQRGEDAAGGAGCALVLRRRQAPKLELLYLGSPTHEARLAREVSEIGGVFRFAPYRE